MKHTLFCILLVMLSISSYAKGDDTSRYHSKNTWAIKGKVLPWTAVVVSGMNYSIGFEYGFKKVNAIGIDVTYTDLSSSHEVYDTAKKTYISGPRGFTVFRGLFINYRRYLHINNSGLYKPISRLFNNDCLPYVSGFLRYGKSDNHFQPGYITSQVSYDEWQYSAGALFGVVSGIMDVNIGPFYKQKYITDVQMENGLVTYSHMQPVWGLRVGINFFFVVTKHRDHYLNEYFWDQYR